MDVSIDEVVGTIQRAPMTGADDSMRDGARRRSPKPLTLDDVRTALAREAQLAARVRAD